MTFLKTTVISTLLVSISILISTCAALSPEGAKCGQTRCDVEEYCSPYDTQCRPCSHICDATTHNHQADDCVKYCQEYLHDQRYVLKADFAQYEDLRDEIQRLRTLFIVTLTLTCLAIIAIIYLLGKAFIRWKDVRNMLQKTFRKSWVKKATNNNKVQDDVEAGVVVKQNGLKLTMPTISATVASASVATNNVNNNSNNNTSNNNSNGNSDSNGTPNTTSTPLSRRHPSEDTTLDYAYDNPAMTPSPEAAQLRTKRESSF